MLDIRRKLLRTQLAAFLHLAIILYICAHFLRFDSLNAHLPPPSSTTLTSFKTVLIDPWICSLSMTSTMFVLLASLRNASLRQNLLAQHNISEFGTHLQRLISSWIGIVPSKSPSIEQSLRLIGEIDRLIRRSL